MLQQFALNTLRAIAPHFQRSINLMYDADDMAYVKGYIPTSRGAAVLATVLGNATIDTPKIETPQRAHVLHAAYGSGKSLLGLVLHAFAKNESDPRWDDCRSTVLNHLKYRFPDEAARISAYQSSERRLLPVLLSGDEGPLDVALSRALSRTLREHHLGHIRPRTQFQAALATIERWRQQYSETLERLQERLRQERTSLDKLERGLQESQPKALTRFERIYPELTAGVQFDRFAGPKLEEVFQATAEELGLEHYTGILIIWDEFGRYMDARSGSAFGPEAALLQSFAEYCNRSGSQQVHLVLITHRLLSSYAADLPLTYQQEWARIAERFVSHDVSGDSLVAYQLITEALSTPDPTAWAAFAAQHHDAFADLTRHTLDLALFHDLDDVSTRQQIIERAWPLHPLAVYALPRLASRVAQNERTMFTFLAANEPGTLAERLEEHDDESMWWLIRLDEVWDYFAEAIRQDTRPGGAHVIWSGVTYALGKTASEETVAQAVIKALGVLLIVSEFNVQSQVFFGRAIPTTSLLAWAVEESEHTVGEILQTLARRRAVVFRRFDGYWTFLRGSDVDLDGEIAAAQGRHVLTPLHMRQLIERMIPPPYHLPRRYNLERRMTRFLSSLYRFPGELRSVSQENFVRQYGPHGYADGIVVYVLVTTPAEREQAIAEVLALPAARVVYIIPDQSLLMIESLRELVALNELRNDPAFMQQDERLEGEIAFWIEDAQHRLVRSLRPLLQVESAGARSWFHDGESWCSEHVSVARLSQLLTQLCERWFPDTPELNNELLNQHAPSGQQHNAVESVIDALMRQPIGAIAPDLGISGQGPDYLIVRTLLVRTGILRQHEGEQWRIAQPADNPRLARMWNLVQEFLADAQEDEQDMGVLIDRLLSPPYGLRRGVLPALLAAMLYARLRVLIVRHNRKIVTPLTGHMFIDMCQHPELYTIEVGPWDARRAATWSVLGEQFREFLTDQEQSQQPLSYLGTSLLRWFRTLPRYCRDTNQMPSDAHQLRQLIRKVQQDPASVLLYELPKLLDDGTTDLADGEAYSRALTECLSRLMDQIASAYQTLLYLLDRFAMDHFAADAPTNQLDGRASMRYWMVQLEQQGQHSFDTLRLGDQLAHRLVEAIRQDNGAPTQHFWERLSLAVLGVSIHDWNDQSVEAFKRQLLAIKERVEHEVHELALDEAAIELEVALPNDDRQTFRFRPSAISSHGQRILQNFKSTLEIAGRPLSLDERRHIVLALLQFVLEEPHANGNHRDGRH